MARHQDLTIASGVPIYFAEHCSPWQRGANENFNGLARQYFPKGTDLAVHSPARVANVTPNSTTDREKASATTPQASDSPPRSLARP